MKPVFKFLSLATVLAVIVSLAGPMIIKAATNSEPDENGNTAGVRLEVSSNGVDFYSPETKGGSEYTITAHPGDTLYFRGYAWNANGSEGNTIYPLYQAMLGSMEYFDESTLDPFTNGNEDIDGNGNDFRLDGPSYSDLLGNYYFDVDLSSPLPVDHDALSPEIGQMTVKLKDTVPVETVIDAAFNIMDTDNRFLEVLGQFLLPQAYAQTAPYMLSSRVTILVEQPPIQVLTATVPEVTQTLPVTGASR